MVIKIIITQLTSFFGFLSYRLTVDKNNITTGETDSYT